VGYFCDVQIFFWCILTVQS